MRSPFPSFADVRRSTAHIVLAATVASLAGCVVGPDYTRPTVPSNKHFVEQQLLAQRNTSQPAPKLDTWWKGFDDPELTRIITRVTAQNLDLAAAMARIDQARAAAREAGAALLPQSSLDAQVVRQYQSIEGPLGEVGSALPGYRRNQTLETLGAGASWELDVAGGLHRGAEAAQAQAQAAQASGMGVRISLAAEAADAYFRVRGAQARIALAQQQIGTEQRLLDLVHLRLTGGLATEREQAQAEALLLEARATVPPLQIELEQQLNRLDVLMGASPGTYRDEVLAGAQHFVVPSIDTDGGPAMLLRRRPDVIAAERQLAASNARIGEAIAQYYPKVSLGALLGVDSMHTGALLTSSAFEPQAALGLHWRLFDFGRVDAEVAQARGANAEALATYRQAMLGATEDVENAIVALSELEHQHDVLVKEVDAHERARAAAEDAYKGGAVSLLDVLDEDRQLLASRDELARVHADDARAAVATFRALGGGWVPAPDVRTARR
ncbi:TolC family protein [Dyella monticola]|uniref:TolC family protein n=1 Tax=Dyella monticola TaxID=1927958 RepID=A0A370X5G1_9GAMM|nr:efflux transporter outer membrane subunit [Dyella monticola]RDS83517.1 TolC family protein [Dyella monticola]